MSIGKKRPINQFGAFEKLRILVMPPCVKDHIRFFNIEYNVYWIYVNCISLIHHSNYYYYFKQLAMVSSRFSLYDLECNLYFFKNFLLWLANLVLVATKSFIIERLKNLTLKFLCWHFWTFVKS
jgi:hypothetical protein